MLLNKLDGTPFATERAAKMSAKNKKQHALEEGAFEIVAVEGGFSIKVADKPVEDPVDKVVEKAVEEMVDEPIMWQTLQYKKARLLDIPEEYKEKRFRYRWVNTKIEGNVEKKMSEGWVVDRNVSEKRKNVGDVHTQIGYDFRNKTQSTGSETRLAELILMKMPHELADSRNAFYRNQANSRVTQDKERLEAELQRGGGSMVGSLNVTKGAMV
jgi:hypothetical protein